MAAIGLSTKEISNILPKGIYVACDNSSTSVTVAGPTKETKAFVEKLQSNGIFTKTLETNNILFHTKYLEPVFPFVLKSAKALIKERKLRSSKWISSSIPELEQQPEWANYSCGEYHYNNFISPVLLKQVFKHIPQNAVIVEVGPHPLFRSVFKRELGDDIVHISLSNRTSTDNEQHLLSAIGK